MSKFKINKNSGYEFSSGERVGWLDRFADGLDQKSAVEVARERSQRSIYEQITSIVSGNKTFASVDDKVKDLQERAGLTEYLRRISQEKYTTKVAANEFDDVLGCDPELKERIASFCKNKIKTFRGHISVPAMQAEINSAFTGVQAHEINDARVATILNAMIEEEKSNNPTAAVNDQNLGLGVGVTLEDDDGSNDDFFSALMPNSKEM